MRGCAYSAESLLQDELLNDSSWLFPVTGTLTRAAAGSDQFSVWNVMEMYRVKVVSAKNTNVAENHKVNCTRTCTMCI